MKAVMRQVEEINRLLTALKKTDSKYLKHDYTKAIKLKTKELKEYCFYKGYDYKEISRRYLYEHH